MLSLDRTPPQVFDWIMLALPWLGTNLTLSPVIAAFALWVWLKRGRGDIALELVILVFGGLLLNVVLKDLFDRPRPDLWAHRGQFKYSAYPSGHAIVGVAVFFTIARLLFRERGWRWPFVVAAVLLAISLYSRLYLGVHWPTDVIGGILMGALWFVAVALAFRPLAEGHTRTVSPGADRPNPTGVGGRSTIESRESRESRASG